MHALEPEAATGYAIAKKMKLRSHQVYPMLSWLQIVHPRLIVLVKTEPLGKQRKFYRLTDEGRKRAEESAKPQPRPVKWRSRKKSAALELGRAILWRLDQGPARESRLIEELGVSPSVVHERLVGLRQGQLIVLSTKEGQYTITDNGRDALYYLKVMTEGVEDL
jgi:DNA-binding PadR family transcriptional regulator